MIRYGCIERAISWRLTSLWGGRKEPDLDFFLAELISELDDGIPCPNNENQRCVECEWG